MVHRHPLVRVWSLVMTGVVWLGLGRHSMAEVLLQVDRPLPEVVAIQMVRVAGLDGGNLPIATTDAWLLNWLFLNWPSEYMFSWPPSVNSVTLPANQRDAGTTKLDVSGESRTFRNLALQKARGVSQLRRAHDLVARYSSLNVPKFSCQLNN